MIREEAILLVEDDPDDRELTRRVLKKNNLCNELVVAHDGEQALDYLFGTGAYEGRDTSVTPQVILLDLGLPKMSGFEVLERIRSDERTSRLPVVIRVSYLRGDPCRKIVKPLKYSIPQSKALGSLSLQAAVRLALIPWVNW